MHIFLAYSLLSLSTSGYVMQENFLSLHTLCVIIENILFHLNQYIGNRNEKLTSIANSKAKETYLFMPIEINGTYAR